MPSLKVSVKWGKEKYDVEADTDDSPLVFKSQLFALTGVQPERQKVMFKGKTLADEDWGVLGGLLKNGDLMMMMGSADALPTAPVAKTKFLEDMTDAQAAAAMDIPAGLKNLGNTCYMNATLQCLKSVPELTQALKTCSGGIAAANSSAPDGRATAISAAVRDLYSMMDRAAGRDSQEVIPLIMLQVMHMVFPQFSTKDDHGHLQQQDANECLTELMRMFQQKIPGQAPAPDVQGDTPASSARSTSIITQYFGGRFDVTLKNKESPEEEIQKSTEDFLQLSCFLSQEVKYLQLGLKTKLVEEISKNSPTLGRDAKYEKSALIARLPAYLNIQMVRFFYKEKDQVNAKILKDVKFPLVLDVFELCTPELQKKLVPMRELLKEEDDRKMERLKAQKAGDEPADVEVSKTEYPFSFPDDVGSNNSGFYELQAVLTHKGRSSNSGHYVGWVRQSGDKWCMCDDDVIRHVTAEDVLKLSGGGDWHCAYVLLYGPRKLIAEKVITANGANGNAVSASEEKMQS